MNVYVNETLNVLMFNRNDRIYYSDAQT